MWRTELLLSLIWGSSDCFLFTEYQTVAFTYGGDFIFHLIVYINFHDSFLQVTDFHPDGRDELSAKNSSVHAFPKEYFSSQKAMSLPSSPHEYSSQASARRENDEMVSTWNKILESHMFQNKLLLPFSEWNIDFSEITVGSRVGIGESSCISALLSYSLYDCYITCTCCQPWNVGFFKFLVININCLCDALYTYDCDTGMRRCSSAIFTLNNFRNSLYTCQFTRHT